MVLVPGLEPGSSTNLVACFRRRLIRPMLYRLSYTSVELDSTLGIGGVRCCMLGSTDTKATARGT